MPIPSVTQTILDPGLGIIAEDTSADTAAIGVSSLGTANTLYAFRGPDTQAVKTTLGTGPLVEKVIYHLGKSNGKTVYAMPINSSVAGANGSVTKSNGSSPTVTVAGAARDDYQAIIAIVSTGALGVGTFKVSLDNGDVYGPVLTIPAGGSYLIPDTNITVTFPSGTYTVGDTYSWTSTAPGFSNTDFGNAMDALLARPEKWGIVHLVGQGLDASAAATLATTMGSKLTTAASSKRYARGVVEGPMVDKATMITAFAAFADARVAVCLGFLELISDVSGRQYKRSIGTPFVARLAKIPISVDAIRNDTDSNIESIPGVVKLVPQGAAASTGYHDEGSTPGGDAARFVTAMTIPGQPGFYFCNPNLMSAPGSDFKWMQYGRIMDRACTVTNQAMTRYLGKRIPLDPATGFILEAEALAIESDLASQLRAALKEPGHVSEIKVVVNRADNLLSSPVLRVKVLITPKAYAKTIEVELGFFNPAVALAA